MTNLLIACADVGSIANGNFGWAANDGEEGSDPLTLAIRVSAALNAGHQVALGFECPLFVPVPAEMKNLGKGRDNEGNRPWSAGAGCAAMATGLVQIAWTLQQIRRQCPGEVPVHFDLPALTRDRGLLIWEAFVSGKSKGGSHIADAKRAVQAFENADGQRRNIFTDRPMSLAALALLWSGWDIDIDSVRRSCLTILIGETGD